MENEKVFAMSFGKVYPMLIAKAERKGRTREEVLEVTSWLTGYTHDGIRYQRCRTGRSGKTGSGKQGIHPV